MKKIVNCPRIIALASLLVAPNLLAHTGHDHSAADSGLVHLLWLAPLLLAGGLLAYRYFSSHSRSKSSDTNDT